MRSKFETTGHLPQLRDCAPHSNLWPNQNSQPKRLAGPKELKVYSQNLKTGQLPQRRLPIPALPIPTSGRIRIHSQRLAGPKGLKVYSLYLQNGQLPQRRVPIPTALLQTQFTANALALANSEF